MNQTTIDISIINPGHDIQCGNPKCRHKATIMLTVSGHHFPMCTTHARMISAGLTDVAEEVDRDAGVHQSED